MNKNLKSLILTAAVCLALVACDSPTKRMEQAQALYNEGVQLREQRRSEEAAERFLQGLALVQRSDKTTETVQLEGQLRDNLTDRRLLATAVAALPQARAMGRAHLLPLEKRLLQLGDFHSIGHTNRLLLQTQNPHKTKENGPRTDKSSLVDLPLLMNNSCMISRWKLEILFVCLTMDIIIVAWPLLKREKPSIMESQDNNLSWNILLVKPRLGLRVSAAFMG